jgi:hypothetical protein
LVERLYEEILLRFERRSSLQRDAASTIPFSFKGTSSKVNGCRLPLPREKKR